MSILIKGMTIPKAGGVLLFIDASGKATEGILQEIAPTISGRECEYEAIEIRPHGRLIDSSFLLDIVRESDSHNNHEDAKMRSAHHMEHIHFVHLIYLTPTVIEAEGREG